MNNLNINKFMNEMSYDLPLAELEVIVVEYQDVIIDYMANSQYNYKMREEFNNVCRVIRSDKFMDTIVSLIQSGDDRIKYDMAYVLYTATHFPNDDIDMDLKERAIQSGMVLRKIEMDDILTDNENVNTAILLSSVKALRSYNTTPFLRSKYAENVLETMPEILYHAFNERYTANNIYDNLIEVIIAKSIPDVKRDEILTALCKSEFNRDTMDKKYVPYASRIQMYGFKLAGRLEESSVVRALDVACKSMNRFNERTNNKITLCDKYMNFALLEALLKSNDARIPNEVKIAYSRLSKYKDNNRRFRDLF